MTKRRRKQIHRLPKGYVQHIALCAGILLVLASVFLTSNFRAYSEMKALKESYQELTNPTEWPDSIIMKFNHKVLSEHDSRRIQQAISQLEWKGIFSEDAYFDSTFTGTTMLHSYSLLIYDTAGTQSWHIHVFEEDSFCYETRSKFTMENSSPLYQALRDIYHSQT